MIGHGKEAVSRRCYGWRVGVCGPVPGPDGWGRASAGARRARGVQRPAMDGAGRGALADDAELLAAVAQGASAGGALDRGGGVRVDGAWSAGVAARRVARRGAVCRCLLWVA